MEQMIQVDLLNSPGQAESATLDRPLDHLVACHRRIEDRLAVLERAVTHLEDRTEEALNACRSVLTFLDGSGMLHTEDEEESVFPRIRLHATSEELAYLDSLELQHRESEGGVARLRNLTRQLERDPSLLPVREALVQTARKLVELYRAHIASENEVLTGIGHARLDEVALAEIAFEMRLRRSRVV
jgi:iron-sulfur cluster repair protein YtfE (RIC family)